MKTLLDSDWLRAVQFNQCKLQIVILDHDWLKDNRKFSKPMICKMMTKILCGNFEKISLKFEKMASRRVFRHLLRAKFFMFILLISNHTVFLIQFGINLHFKKLKLHSPKRRAQFQLFEKLTRAN